MQDDAKFVDDDDSDGGGGVSRELEQGPEEVEVDEVEEGMKRLSKEAARALALPVPLETVLLLAERDVVLDAAPVRDVFVGTFVQWHRL